MSPSAPRDAGLIITLGLRALIAVVGAALVATVAAEPLGVLEAQALARLHTLAAPGQALWPGLWPGLIDCFSQGWPALNLGVGALLAGAGAGDALALRAADVAGVVGLLAAVLLSGRHLGQRSEVFAALLVASPLIWAAPVVVTGWGVNAAALFALYRLSVDDAPAPVQRLLAALLIAALVINGAGLAVISVLAGAMLHAGLTRSRWQVLGQARNVLFLFLAVVGLQLSDRLVVPEFARLVDNARAVVDALSVTELMPGAALVAAVLAGGVVLALVALQRGRAPGAIALMLLAAVLLAAASPASALGWLVPLAVLLAWLVADGLAVARTPWLAYLAGLALLAWTVALVGDAAARLVSPQWASGFMAAGAGLVVCLAGAVCLLKCRERLGVAALGVVAALCVLSLCHDTHRVFDTRNARAAVVARLPAVNGRPAAVLAPQSSVYWSALLARPVFRGADVSALCQWRKSRPATPAPLVILAPAGITERLHLHLLQQTPGSPTGSVVVAELLGCGKDPTSR